MKYLCLVYCEGKEFDAMSPSELEALNKESMAYNQDLQRRGHFLAAEALQSVESAVTVRMRRGKVSTTDGPFAETKEQLCGFILIQAQDLNEAIQVASNIPLAKLGSIEVRPILHLS